MTEAFICDFVRTPIGRYGGAFREVRADELAAIPLRALIERNSGVDWGAVDDVIFGCANQAGEDNRNVARMAALLAGLPVTVTGATINRLCGSGLDAVAIAARAIKSGETDLVLAGGVESMTRAPFVIAKSEQPFSRNIELFDTTIGWRFINEAMRSRYGVDSMPETAENVAEDYRISREAQDTFAYRSQQRYSAARTDGFFKREIIPVTLSSRRGTVVVEEDEHPRPDTTLEGLATLKTPFRQGGTVTAGNAAGLNDGAAALILASPAAMKRHGLTPRARVIAVATAGVAPRVMGIGPVPAVLKLLEKTSLSLNDVDVIELNEAFSAQALAVTRLLGLQDDDRKVNPHGGAIAIGHPLGCSGARLVMTAVSAMEVHDVNRAIVTMCIGVGQGIAALLERT